MQAGVRWGLGGSSDNNPDEAQKKTEAEKAADKEEGEKSEAGTGRHRDKRTDRRAER